jgi:hypothetical protein
VRRETEKREIEKEQTQYYSIPIHPKKEKKKNNEDEDKKKLQTKQKSYKWSQSTYRENTGGERTRMNRCENSIRHRN